MKNSLVFSVLFTIAGLFFVLPEAISQEKPVSRISYSVPFGPQYPIEGESFLLESEIDINDKTGAIEALNFEVQLWTFNGFNSGYLAWIGNSQRFPNMRFKSNEIVKGKKNWKVKGDLEFRNRWVPVTLFVNRLDTDEYTILEGEFNFRPKDHFLISPSNDLVPRRIPMEFSFVFEKLIN